MFLLQIPKPSSRKAKKKGIFWGIEVAETLQWRGWELGKEVIKHLVLKNVHEKTQKLSYRCVGRFLLLFLLTLSLHLHSSAPSITSAPTLLSICPSSLGLCTAGCVHAGAAGQKPTNSDAQPLFPAGVFKMKCLFKIRFC